jgi:hypothetical protein
MPQYEIECLYSPNGAFPKAGPFPLDERIVRGLSTENVHILVDNSWANAPTA